MALQSAWHESQEKNYGRKKEPKFGKEVELIIKL